MSLFKKGAVITAILAVFSLIFYVGGLHNRLSYWEDEMLIKTKDALNRIKETGGVPSGSIVIFHGKCPDGWTNIGEKDFNRFAGRVIVVAGPKTGSTSDRKLGEQGGEEFHELTIDELPKHKHEIDKFELGHTVHGNNDKWRIDSDDGPSFNGIKEILRTTKVGGSQAHNNMQPFIALSFCGKNE